MYEKIKAWMYSNQWAITDEALQAVISVVEKYDDLSTEELSKIFHAKYNKESYEAFLPSGGMRLDGTQMATLHGSVAVVPLLGPIFPRANFMTVFSGATDIDGFGNDIKTALENPEVSAVVINVDSPGGAITGVAEMGEFISKAEEKYGKKVVAYIYGMGASAAYWIPSGASEIVLAPTGMVGSIGVVAGYTDTSERDAKNGVKSIEIVSSVSPNKRPDPTTDSGRAQIQERVDELGKIFVGTVAENRNTTTDDVLDNFGKGGMLIGENAVRIGMADRISTLAELIQELNANENSTNSEINFNSNDGGKSMDYATLKAEHSDLFEQVKAEGHAEGKAEGLTEGVKQENERIKSIEDLSTPGSAKIVAESKFDSSLSSGDVALLIVENEKKVKEKAKANLEADASEANEDALKVDSSELSDNASQTEDNMVANMREGAK